MIAKKFTRITEITGEKLGCLYLILISVEQKKNSEY